MTLKLNSSSSGSVSFVAPASTTAGADINLALPVDGGTVDRLERAGNILQVKNKIFSSDPEFTSTSFANVSSFVESLATSATSSKVLIILNITLYTFTTTNGASARITWDGNNTAETQRQYTTSSGISGTISLMTLVSPGKTSSIDYQVQVKSELASHTCAVNRNFSGANTSHSELILMEVAA